MKKRDISIALLAVFLLSAVINYCILFHWRAYTPPDKFESLEMSILQIHGLFVTMILGGLFAKAPLTGIIPKALSIVCLCLCLLWAAFVTLCWSGYPYSTDIGAVIAQLDSHAKDASFLVAGIMTYLFSSSMDAEAEPRN